MPEPVVLLRAYAGLTLRRRKATNQDTAEVTRFIAEVLAEYGLELDLDERDADLQDVELSYGSRGFFDLLEDDCGRLQGMVAIRPRDGGDGELRRLYLAPEVRGRGLGKYLLRNALSKAYDLGFRRVELVTATALKEAVQLYQRIGFRPIAADCDSCCDQAFVLELGSRFAIENRMRLRDFEQRDIQAFVDYWYRSAPSFIRSLGVDPEKMTPEDTFSRHLAEQVTSNLTASPSSLAMLTVELDGQPVGVHSLSELVRGRSAVFHAHLWSELARGIGLGTCTYPRAARIFMDRFELEELVFKTPRANLPANRIKEKLGLAPCGEEALTYDFMLPGVLANVYRLPRSRLNEMLAEAAPIAQFP
jgi:putative acetyltransferase